MRKWTQAIPLSPQCAPTALVPALVHSSGAGRTPYFSYIVVLYYAFRIPKSCTSGQIGCPLNFVHFSRVGQTSLIFTSVIRYYICIHT
eukprot:1159703-Pelagomonas_calceolata.AAC.5